MDRHAWIATRAYYLWERAGKPPGCSEAFWLLAERDRAAWEICVLNPGACPYQHVEPTSGGRHVTICMHGTRECGNRAFQQAG